MSAGIARRQRVGWRAPSSAPAPTSPRSSRTVCDGMVDVGAGLLEQRQRPRAHHLDAEIFEDVHRGLVDRLDLVGRQHRIGG